jgi:hypothetical protein
MQNFEILIGTKWQLLKSQSSNSRGMFGRRENVLHFGKVWCSAIQFVAPCHDSELEGCSILVSVDLALARLPDLPRTKSNKHRICTEPFSTSWLEDYN